MAEKRILICDDESGIRQLVKSFLTRHHYEVTEAISGEELLRALANSYFDLVILDLMKLKLLPIRADQKIKWLEIILKKK